MLNWAITFFIIALIAAVLGFTGIAVAAAGIAKLMFVVFLVLFLVSLITHFGRRNSSVLAELGPVTLAPLRRQNT
jgi:uncharacterized membrane protein YtjA (UPF0391 family)